MAIVKLHYRKYYFNALGTIFKKMNYTRQSGGEIPVFYGARTQRRHGLGIISCGLFRRALSFLSSGAKILGQYAMNVASDMIDGMSFQDSAKSRLNEGIKSFVTSNAIIPQSGSRVRSKRRHQPSRKQSKKTKKKKRVEVVFA